MRHKFLFGLSLVDYVFTLADQFSGLWSMAMITAIIPLRRRETFWDFPDFSSMISYLGKGLLLKY